MKTIIGAIVNPVLFFLPPFMQLSVVIGVLLICHSHLQCCCVHLHLGQLLHGHFHGPGSLSQR